MPPRRLDEAYGLVVSTDRSLARRLALPLATDRCQSGYVLLARDVPTALSEYPLDTGRVVAVS